MPLLWVCAGDRAGVSLRWIIDLLSRRMSRGSLVIVLHSCDVENPVAFSYNATDPDLLLLEDARHVNAYVG